MGEQMFPMFVKNERLLFLNPTPDISYCSICCIWYSFFYYFIFITLRSDAVSHGDVPFVRVEGVVELPNNKLWIVEELCASGSLHDILHKRKQVLTIDEVRKIARTIAVGLRWLHSLHYIHRDIKSDNILVFLLVIITLFLRIVVNVQMYNTKNCS